MSGCGLSQVFIHICIARYDRYIDREIYMIDNMNKCIDMPFEDQGGFRKRGLVSGCGLSQVYIAL